MSLTFTLEYDTRELAVLTQALNINTLKKAVVRSVNRTAQKVRTELNKQIRTQIKLKAKDVNAEVNIYKASTKNNLSNIKANLRIKGSPMPLIKYSAKQVKQGVSVNVKGTRKVVRHAFIAKMRSGHQSVFLRKGKKRLPIKALYSVRISDVARQSELLAGLQKVAHENFSKVFWQNVRYLGSR